MKRKKFVKQLMALGYDRNEANREATLAQLECIPYRTRYAQLYMQFSLVTWLPDAIPQLCEFVNNAVNALVQAVQRLLPAVAELVQKKFEILKTITDELKKPGGGGNE